MSNDIRVKYLSYYLGECSLIFIEFLKANDNENDNFSFTFLYEYLWNINRLNNKIEEDIYHYRCILFVTKKAINKQSITTKDLYELLLLNNIERIGLSNEFIDKPDIEISIRDMDFYKIIKSYRSVAMNCLLPKNLTLFVEYE